MPPPTHPHHPQVAPHSDQPLDDDATKRLPWWKTPSPLWLLIILPFTTIASTATLAPRIEIYTLLACSVHKPDILHNITGSTSTPCAADPVVQAAVAKLSAIITATMGILGCLTTGWWGSLSDRYGRTRVMGISCIGLLIADINFIFVSHFSHRLPGGYWFLLFGPFIEGSLGGFTTAVAATHAYFADTTTESTRSRIFSLSLGLIFAGVALGPMLGGLLIRAVGNAGAAVNAMGAPAPHRYPSVYPALSVFWATGALHMLYGALVWFVLPESVSREDMLLARERRRVANASAGVSKVPRGNGRVARAWGSAKRVAGKVFGFLSPLTVFWPAKNRKGQRDWSLMLLAAAYGTTISIMGSYAYMFQYAASAFGWSSETIGYWLSLVGATRAVFLTLVLPVGIKVFGPGGRFWKGPPEPESTLPPSEPSTTTTELSSSSTESSPLIYRTHTHTPHTRVDTTTPTPTTKSTHRPHHHTLAFDLTLARLSLLIEIVAYTIMALAATPGAFTLASLLGAMGVGFSPAVQTVALGMYVRRGGQGGAGTGVGVQGQVQEGQEQRGQGERGRGREGAAESGKLFGALSVVQALCSQILGPAMYGLVYMKTVGTHPRTIFWVTMGTVFISFGLLAFVRVRAGGGDEEEVGTEEGVEDNEGDESEGEEQALLGSAEREL